MDKKSVIEFFNRLAPQWDSDMIRSDEIINIILDNAMIGESQDVLDVACGTGVLIPDYLARKVSSVTGIDISPEMVEIAKKKFPEENVRIICADVEETDPDMLFDRIVVYNALPHFPEPERLVSRLSELLKSGGVLTVAHGMSAEKINNHHSGTANAVSMRLLDAEELTMIFSKHLKVMTVISDDRMYQVAGMKV